MSKTVHRFIALASAGLVLSACVSIDPQGGGSPLPSTTATLPITTPVVTLQPTGTPLRSLQPTSEPTAEPTATATTEPTASPTTEPTATATSEPTATPTTEPTAAPTLNFSLPAVFGSTDLSSGFTPDPFTFEVTAGGDANASNLEDGCRGFTTAAPTFKVSYTSGSATLLRFYFVASSGDTTMVVNTPSGEYVCGDDSYGTLNPTLDFNSPSSNRYDIWVATYAEGASISGTLYVTELDGNHPE